MNRHCACQKILENKMKAFRNIVLISIMLAATVSPLFAEEAAAAPEEAAVSATVSQGRGLEILGASIGAGLCVIGGSLGISKIGAQASDAIARQPEASGQMFAPMIITAAMIEGGMLFAVVVCLLGVIFA